PALAVGVVNVCATAHDDFAAVALTDIGVDRAGDDDGVEHGLDRFTDHGLQCHGRCRQGEAGEVSQLGALVGYGHHDAVAADVAQGCLNSDHAIAVQAEAAHFAALHQIDAMGAGSACKSPYDGV